MVVIASCALVTQGYRPIHHKLHKHHRGVIEEMADYVSNSNILEEGSQAQKDTRSDTEVDKLIAEMNAEKCMDQKMTILQKYLWKRPLPTNWVITGKQLNRIASVFKEFTFVHKGVIEMTQPYVTGISATDLVELLKSVDSYNNNRLKVLDTLKDSIFDPQLNKKAILEAFNTDQRVQAEGILDAAKGASIVGIIKESSVVFVLDYSPSMLYKFQHKNGNTYTRLDYAKKYLSMMINSLKPNQKFNVIAFDHENFALRSSMVAGTTENIMAMIKDINALKPRENAGSRPFEAIRTAFGMDSEALYFLSDGGGFGGGHPVAARQEVRAIHSHSRLDKKLSPVRVNTICFWPGGDLRLEIQPKIAATAYMKYVSEAVVGGTYTLME
jgi:hypothetical protein